MVKDDASIMKTQYHLINLSCILFQIYKLYTYKLIQYFCDNVYELGSKMCWWNRVSFDIFNSQVVCIILVVDFNIILQFYFHVNTSLT